MKDINAERLDALEWAIEAGNVITQSYDGHFVATANGDTDEPWVRHRQLALLADELVRIRAQIKDEP